jgi:hypothetical protein
MRGRNAPEEPLLHRLHACQVQQQGRAKEQEEQGLRPDKAKVPRRGREWQQRGHRSVAGPVTIDVRSSALLRASSSKKSASSSAGVFFDARCTGIQFFFPHG